jgi:cis-3-alkyl-4-acyloxetan-2-one decarboxylase
MMDRDTLLHKWLRLPHLLNVGFDNHAPQPKATVVLVHGLANSHAMWGKVIQQLDTSHVRVISVDLLGFGASPKPIWQTYSTTIHARSLWLTLQRLRVKSPLVIVGHSLGALVAIQYASRYKRGLHSLLLCSPPFYKPTELPASVRIGRPKQPDDAYHLLYRNSRYRQEITVRLAKIIKAARLASKHFVVNDETLPAIVGSLEMSIENQTSLEDAKRLRLPIHLLYGQFDPLIIKHHFQELKRANRHVILRKILAAHEVSESAAYRHAVITEIQEILRRPHHA